MMQRKLLSENSNCRYQFATGKAKTRTRDNDTSLRSWRRTRQRRDAYELGSNQALVDFPRTWGVENK